jgi:RNase P subunit RPR2
MKERCQDCKELVSIDEITVKETEDGMIIYCLECDKKHKELYKQINKLIKEQNLNLPEFT